MEKNFSQLCPFYLADGHLHQALTSHNKLNPQDFLQCNNCKIILSLHAKSTNYEQNYFDQEYISQYGKSYLDDKKNIQRRMKWRLSLLWKYTTFNKQSVMEFHNSKPKLLEIGSAAGFFLELCKEQGFDATGWEISQKMTNFANSNGNKTIQGDFLALSHQEIRQKKEIFDIISAFYVIEHFGNQLLLWKNITQLLKPGGLLLFSLPSSHGPALKFHPKNWQQKHPNDHFVDYSPKSISKVGKLFGFELLVAKSEGIHPLRFPFGKYRPFSFIYRTYQKWRPFSDTMFVILRKL